MLVTVGNECLIRWVASAGEGEQQVVDDVENVG